MRGMTQGIIGEQWRQKDVLEEEGSKDRALTVQRVNPLLDENERLPTLEKGGIVEGEKQSRSGVTRREASCGKDEDRTFCSILLMLLFWFHKSLLSISISCRTLYLLSMS